MHVINSVSSFSFSSAAPAVRQAEVQSLKGDGDVLANDVSEYAKISEHAFRAVQNAFGARAQSMLALTAQD